MRVESLPDTPSFKLQEAALRSATTDGLLVHPFIAVCHVYFALMDGIRKKYRELVSALSDIRIGVAQPNSSVLKPSSSFSDQGTGYIFARVNHGLEDFHINLTSLGHDAEKAVGGLLQFAPDLLHSLSHGHSESETADAADALGDLGEDAAGLSELLVRVAPSSEAIHFNQTATGHEIEGATGDVPALPLTVLTWLRGGAEEERYVKTRRGLVNKMVRGGVLDKLD
ncbi:predicted protein [Postia placenta Mad-698-R]|uniref:Uncharacterized protein n=1 Tax=Postia placenta MAD-698-R-SB12 TaxID=670580 RepID=A0A1X6ND67_9APHY|nr:hypothetical protein POSPLADRAFT_1043979 [Postia placenta MAD-698-R-SB12]EED79398.1 predicted protein [Postia placenta Mad-698-R]OSX66587.1 hypothetical protein POSPLADRAFT_1043979 [Postia placenta MAD-698-R-SB12]